MALVLDAGPRAKSARALAGLREWGFRANRLPSRELSEFGLARTAWRGLNKQKEFVCGPEDLNITVPGD
jgi:hypothetical protein